MDGSDLVRLADGKLPGLGFGEAVLRLGEVVFVGGGGFLNIGGLERGRRVVDRERDSNPGRCSCDEVRRQHTAGITFVASSKKTFSKKKCIFRSELS